MSDETSCAELDGQHVELLPARTVLSLVSVVDLDTGGAPGITGTPGPSVPGTGPLNPLGSQPSLGESGGAGSSDRVQSIRADAGCPHGLPWFSIDRKAFVSSLGNRLSSRTRFRRSPTILSTCSMSTGQVLGHACPRYRA